MTDIVSTFLLSVKEWYLARLQAVQENIKEANLKTQGVIAAVCLVLGTLLSQVATLLSSVYFYWTTKLNSYSIGSFFALFYFLAFCCEYYHRFRFYFFALLPDERRRVGDTIRLLQTIGNGCLIPISILVLYATFAQ